MTEYESHLNAGEYVDIPDDVENGASSSSKKITESASSQEITFPPLEKAITLLGLVFILFYLAMGAVIARESGRINAGAGFIVCTLALQFFAAAFVLIIVLLVSMSRGNILQLTTPKRFMSFAFMLLLYSNIIVIPIILAFLWTICCWFVYFEVKSDEKLSIVSKFKAELELWVKDNIMEKASHVTKEIVDKERVKIEQRVQQMVETQIRASIQNAMGPNMQNPMGANIQNAMGGVQIDRVE